MLIFLFFSFFFFRCRFFISSRSLLWSILSSQTGPPTIIIFDPTTVLEAFWGSQGHPKSTQQEPRKAQRA